MVSINTALIARDGTIALLGPQSEALFTSPLETPEDAEAVIGEVAVALYAAAARREQRGWRWVRNTLQRLWRARRTAQ